MTDKKEKIDIEIWNSYFKNLQTFLQVLEDELKSLSGNEEELAKVDKVQKKLMTFHKILARSKKDLLNHPEFIHTWSELQEQLDTVQEKMDKFFQAYGLSSAI